MTGDDKVTAVIADQRPVDQKLQQPRLLRQDLVVRDGLPADDGGSVDAHQSARVEIKKVAANAAPVRIEIGECLALVGLARDRDRPRRQLQIPHTFRRNHDVRFAAEEKLGSLLCHFQISLVHIDPEHIATA